MSASSLPSLTFCEKAFDLNLFQVITEPTHIQGNILDVVITNNPDLIYNITVDKSTTSNTKSDHYLITFNIYASKRKNKHNQTSCPPKSVPIYSKADTDGIASFFHHLSSRITLRSSPNLNINNAWNHIRDIFHSVTRIFVPHATPSSKSYPKWFTPEIRHKLNKLHTLRRSVKNHPTTHKTTRLAEEESSLQTLMADTKHQHELQLAQTHNSNPKQLLKYLNHLSKQNRIPTVLQHNQQLITSPQLKANLFNDYFHSVFTKSNFTLPSIDHLPSPSNQLSSLSIDSNEVYEALTSLDPNKSTGCDDISPLLLKLSASSLLPQITSLFNQSLQTKSVPQEWKIHKIIPIHKNGDKSLVSNYRPISLLCTLSKVLEHIIYNKIYPFILPLISSCQFGFLRKRSSICQLLKSYEEIFASIESGQNADVIYLDFKKAFDSVPHSELLFKLWHMGITGPLWLWFRNYLKDRLHYVEIEGVSSPKLPVISGVPQGSILGPLLFIIYINDLSICPRFSSLFLYADDSKLIHTLSSFNDHLLQSDIESLVLWCNTWNLSLNPNKCACIRFSLSSDQHNTPPKYTINDQIIPVTPHQRDLGIIVCNNLSWRKHLEAICSSAYQALNFLRRCDPIRSSPIQLRKCLYFILIRSKLSYCSLLWRPHLIQDIIMIEQVQRRATKFILLDFTSNYKDRLIALNLLPLMYWLELLDIFFLIKCLLYPPDNFNILNYVSFKSSSTRFGSSNKLQYNYRRCNTTRHYYFNRIVRLWNKLPPINLSLPYRNIKQLLISIFWEHFVTHFNQDHPCTYHYSCPCSKCLFCN